MPKIMWQPSPQSMAKSQMSKFIHSINERHRTHFSTYSDLYQWSIDNKDLFWESLWFFCSVKASKLADQVFIPGNSMREAKWFTSAGLNFAENLLSRYDDHLAIIFNNERNERRTLTYKELHDAVGKVASYFKKLGIKKYDRIVAVLPNMPEAIIAMLATTSLGAIWSSCSPDFGNEGLYDRFHQISPKILIMCDGYFYNGKYFSAEDKITWLQERLPSVIETIRVNYTDANFACKATNLEDILNGESSELLFEQLPFNHPVYIMYSSGTTGIPKCIVHGAGGTLLQHLKELQLHTDLSMNDRIFYYTTCGWMMWNWYISSLAIGATVIQYDGAPFYPDPIRLLDFIDEEKITVFGTSAKYISALEKHDMQPNTNHNFLSLRTILSTGSPLVARNFDYVYNAIKKDVCLSSISGGTDIISCFALGNPLLPVYSGELQCIGLGMNVKIFNDAGEPVIGEKGELVCVDAFPSMPIYFWNDEDGQKYHHAYFDKFEGVWAHGDFAELTERNTLIIYGRSDATLNPGGVRIGTAEIYRQVEKIPKIMDSLAVSQECDDDNRIILFVILKDQEALTAELVADIKAMIKTNCSPRHVPAKIIAVPDIPRTLNGKILEIAVREIIHKRPIKNLSAIANPESLEFFKNLAL